MEGADAEGGYPYGRDSRGPGVSGITSGESRVLLGSWTGSPPRCESVEGLAQVFEAFGWGSLLGPPPFPTFCGIFRGQSVGLAGNLLDRETRIKSSRAAMKS